MCWIKQDIWFESQFSYIDVESLYEDGDEDEENETNTDSDSGWDDDDDDPASVVVLVWMVLIIEISAADAEPLLCFALCPYLYRRWAVRVLGVCMRRYVNVFRSCVRIYAMSEHV